MLQSSPFTGRLTQTPVGLTGAGPVHPPSQTITVHVFVSEVVVEAGQLATVAGQLVMVMVFTTTVVESVVLVL